MIGRRRPTTEAAPPVASLRPAALRLLGRRDYTRAELADRLATRGYSSDDIDRVLDALAAERLVDDERVARAHVRMAQNIKRRGRRRIERELQARGVPAAIAHAALGDLGDDDEVATLRRLVDRQPAGVPASPADRRRLFQRLLRRGFDAAMIARVLDSRDEHAGDSDGEDPEGAARDLDEDIRRS